jgi:hypothetical protein
MDCGRTRISSCPTLLRNHRRGRCRGVARMSGATSGEPDLIPRLAPLMWAMFLCRIPDRLAPSGRDREQMRASPLKAPNRGWRPMESARSMKDSIFEKMRTCYPAVVAPTSGRAGLRAVTIHIAAFSWTPAGPSCAASADRTAGNVAAWSSGFSRNILPRAPTFEQTANIESRSPLPTGSSWAVISISSKPALFRMA